MKRRWPVALAVLVLAAPWALGQGMIGFSGGGGGTRDGSFQGNATFHLPLRTPPAVVNAPYSGEDVNENVQTLADGTHVTRQGGQHQKTWRDSQGRVRMERPFVSGPAVLKNAPTLVEIVDPVAGYAYIMDDITRVAHRIKLAAGGAKPQSQAMMAATQSRVVSVPAPGPAGAGQRPAAAAIAQMQSSGPHIATANGVPTVPTAPEDLGSKLIDGVLVYGTRTTRVIPTGTQGNDGPITTTQEAWFSRQLNLSVLTVNFDPRQGTSTGKVANLSLNEPDPTLFVIPSGYAIVDETESFTIQWGEK
jgi:hypothetical protein